MINKSLELAPNYPDNYFFKALILAHLRNFKEALISIAQGKQLEGNSPQILQQFSELEQEIHANAQVVPQPQDSPTTLLIKAAHLRTRQEQREKQQRDEDEEQEKPSPRK